MGIEFALWHRHQQRERVESFINFLYPACSGLPELLITPRALTAAATTRTTGQGIRCTEELLLGAHPRRFSSQEQFLFDELRQNVF